MRRKIALFLLCVVLLAGAIGNYSTISNPQRKMTTYYRTHYWNAQMTPDIETDVPATMMVLLGVNLSVACAAGIVCIAGGLAFRKPVVDDSIFLE